MDDLNDYLKKGRRENHLENVREKLDKSRSFLSGIIAVYASLATVSWLIDYFEPLLSPLPHTIGNGRWGILSNILALLIQAFSTGMVIAAIIPLAWAAVAFGLGLTLYWLLGLSIRPFMFLYTCIYDLIDRLRN